MELLINQGDFEILAATAVINDEEGKQTFHEVIKTAATTCYQSAETTKKTAEEFTKMLREVGHWSMFDHVHVTVRFKNCSRGFTHELVRHRIAAYAQESTRYVDESDLHIVCPPHKDPEEKIELVDIPGNWLILDEEAYPTKLEYQKVSFKDMASIIECFYRSLKVAEWKNEDARQILPIGTKSEIVMTADLTEWRHVFALRTQKPAHWEIRRVMGNLLLEFQKMFAPVFDDFKLTGQDENGVNYFTINKQTTKN